MKVILDTWGIADFGLRIVGKASVARATSP